VSKRAKVWAVSTRKGGVLKTSMTVNIAGVLAKKYKVLIIDMDTQGNVLLSFGQNPDNVRYTIRDVLTSELTEPRKAIKKVHKNIDVLPANDDMGDFEFEVIPNKDKYPHPFMLLRQTAQELLYKYDYILIDTPPNFGLIQGNALMFADKVIVPFQPEGYSMRALVKILGTIDRFREEYKSDLELMGVVATMVDMRTSLHAEIMEQTRKFCRKNHIPLMDTIIPKSIRYAASISHKKKPVTISQPKHDVSLYYYELVDELEEEMAYV
jgi:chromosome partitioning protein